MIWRRVEQHTVLVVEDEVFIREDVSQHLEDCGFTVLQAANADEALKVIQSRADIDLVFTDVRMPGEMDGLQLAAWVLEQRPNIPVIIASGDFGRAAAIRELCGAHHAFTKPYQLDDVVAKMRHAIRSRKSASDPPN
jgi:DNA-binding NtrC family response regulator